MKTIGMIAALVGLFTVPLYSKIDNVGIRDWDQHLFYFGSVLKTVGEYRQFPMWNPWYCGGSVLYQNPQVPLLSPVYLLAPFMGMLPAVKISVGIYYGIALFGMFLLARMVYGLSNRFLIFLSCSVFVFSGTLSLHIAEGQTHMFGAAFFPFVLLGYELYLSRKRSGWLILGSTSLALILWTGGIYAAPLITLFMIVYAALRAAVEQSIAPLRGLAAVGVYAFLFSALRLVPVMDYMRDYPRIAMGREFVPPAVWDDIFFTREQSLFTEVTLSDSSFPSGRKMQWGWHEYGSYVGVPMAMILGAAFIRTGVHARGGQTRGRDLVLPLCWFGFFVLFVGDFAFVNPYRVLKQFPFFSSFHVTGRFLIPLMFVSSLVFMSFMRWVEGVVAARRLLNYSVAVICVLVVGDLMWVTRQPLGEAFTIEPAAYQRAAQTLANGSPYQAIESLPILTHHSVSTMYPALLAEMSTVNCYEPLKPRQGYELGEPLVFSADPGISISNIQFSPNQIAFDLDAEDYGWVVLNQNFTRGWSLSGAEIPVVELGHKPAVRFSPGSYRNLDFSFFPRSIWWGFTLTCIGVVFAIRQLYAGHIAGRVRRHR
ncbi:MAG: hypothetical protein QF660_02110 [Anaerolineales bacterium]|nr:hypothetical protein [Anaerolineales bacterium]